MPIRAQVFYPRLNVPALSLLKRPGGFLSVPRRAWDQVYTLGAGQFARFLALEPDTVQRAVTQSWSPIPATAFGSILMVQALSDPLVRQSVPAGTWRMGFGGITTNAQVGALDWTGYVSLFVVNGLTGQVRSTLLENVTIGALRNQTAERTVYDPLSCPACEILTGDYLAFEFGLNFENTSAAGIVPTASVFSDGGTEILADNVSTTDARAILIAPVPLTLSLPQSGEAPDPSRTYEESLDEVRGLWPGGASGSTHHDFGTPDSPDAQMLAWLAQVLKTYLWDLLDLMERERNPARAVLKLEDWRALFGFARRPRRVEELRALVIARLREFGPTSLFNVAASIGVVLGYANPQQLEILEISAAQLRAALEYVDDMNGVPVLIPEAAAFGAGNLVRITPFMRDGAAVWGSGAYLTLVFSDPDGATQVNARLTTPDGRQKTWVPITRWDPQITTYLYGVELAGAAVHGQWTLELYREVGSPVVSLAEWRLWAPGSPWASVGPVVAQPAGPPPWSPIVPNTLRTGLGAWKFWWGVYADPLKMGAVIPADLGEARMALARLRHAYQKADLITTKVPVPQDLAIPMANNPAPLPDGCIPT